MSATMNEPKAKPTQAPLFEGYRVSEHRIAFAGNAVIDDLDVLELMHLKSGEVRLVVTGKVVARKHKKLEKDGNPTGLESTTTLLVESVSLYDED